jgi:hypothetical protein
MWWPQPTEVLKSIVPDEVALIGGLVALLVSVNPPSEGAQPRSCLLRCTSLFVADFVAEVR